MEYMFDYLRFTVKTDVNAVNPYPVDLSFIQSLLGVSDDVFNEFQSIGKGSMFYADMLRYFDISIGVPFPDTADKMGYMVTMTGSGCRLFEKFHNGDVSCWYYLFKRLKNAVDDGCAVNICRLDIAFDDKSEKSFGLLDLNEIERCAANREYVSLFRISENINSVDTSLEFKSRKCRKNNYLGHTVEFGNRKSNAFLRFYDKRTQQLMTEYGGKLENAPDDFQKINHWVRMEFEFKKTVAIKIVNAFLLLGASRFNDWLAELVNTYIRFVDLDDSRSNRCTVKEWWLNFVGTIEKASLKSGHFSKSDYVSSFKWFERSLAPTLCALLSRLGSEKLIELIEVYGSKDRWKAKHERIADNTSPVFDYNLSNRDVWLSNIPLSILDDDFFDTDSIGFVVDSGEAQLEFENSDFANLDIPDIEGIITEWDDLRETMYNLGFVEVL